LRKQQGVLQRLERPDTCRVRSSQPRKLGAIVERNIAWICRGSAPISTAMPNASLRGEKGVASHGQGGKRHGLLPGDHAAV